MLTRLLIVVVMTLIVSAITVGLFGWRKLNAIENVQDDIQFSQFEADWSTSTDYVQPTVNTIQFLRYGYSITFDSVQYTQDGLALTGTLGNSTNLWVSSLALDMTAQPHLYRVKDRWLKQGKQFWWDTGWDIGHAQTTVGLLNPGSTAEFRVTIPNVRQTSEGFQTAVSFSGERYQYLGR